MTVSSILISPVLLLAQEAVKPKERSLLEYIQSGGFMSYVLIILSFIALALVIRYLIEVRQTKIIPPGFAEELLARCRAGNVEGARQLCIQPDFDSFLARTVSSAIRRCQMSSLGMLEIRTAIEESGQREADRLFRLTDGIGLAAALGPMLGLLGTVLGMIGAFATIGDAEGASRSHQLASYMSIALVATAEGLFVAVPCTAMYSLFRRRIERLIAPAAEVTEQVAALLERSGEAAPVKPVAPRPVSQPVPVRPARVP